MKKNIVIAIVSILLGLAGGWLIFRSSNSDALSQDRKILYYRDPMNPQLTSPTPKKASDGMDYVPVYAESSSSNSQKKIAYWKDPMHPWYTSNRPGKAPDCGMDLVPVYEGDSDVKGIKIDPATVQNIGVQVETVKRRKMSRIIRTTGTVQPNEQKLFTINTKIMGWAEKLYVNYSGMVVRKGQPLMELYSPELVTTQQEYLQSLQYQKKLQNSSLDVARKGSDELVQSAKNRLLNWDIPESEIQVLEERGTPKKTMTIYSPTDGVVMEKMIQQGQNVMAGMELYRIADLSTVWIVADIYQFELPWVKVGQTSDIELSYLPGRTFKGRITFVYPYLNEETKTVKVRIDVPNTASFELKPDMYATVKIVSPIIVNAIAVPDQAIIRSGERTIAVIDLGGGYFDPREVKLGVMADGYDQVLEGIEPGEKIVTSSEFLIDSESNLKAAVDLMANNTGMDKSKQESGSIQTGDKKMTGSAGKLNATDMKNMQKKQKPKEQNKKNGNMEMQGMKMDMNMGMSEGSDSSSIKKDSIKAGNVKIKAVDPVCGMDADPSGKYKADYQGKIYYFCSKDDMEKFKNEPQKYIHGDHQH